MIAASNDAQVQPVWANPFTIRPAIAAAPFGMSISYPFPTRALGGSSGNGNANKYYLHAVINDWTFSALEYSSAPRYEVTNWDDLSVSVRYHQGDSNVRIESTLTSGMAYVTAKYFGLTPRFVSAHAILTVNGQSLQSGAEVSGTRFVVSLNNGQRWVLYSSTTVTLRADGQSSLVGKSKYTGYARVAYIANDAHLSALDRSSRCVIEGSDVEAKDASSYGFLFRVSGDCGSGLLHYLQLHHTDTLDRSSAEVLNGIPVTSTTRGPMQTVVAKNNPPVFRFSDSQDIPVDFYPPRRPSSSDVVSQRMKETLQSDIDASWSLPLDGSYYFNGKAAHKYANLCLVASDENVTGGDKDRLLRKCLDKLEALLAPLLENRWKYPLQYDTVYRGILSSQGFVANDANVDFGNTMYNDHHYHFGYWIATSAIINFLDPSWSRISELNRVTSFLVRDVANPTTQDVNFPKFRNFDWYRGHSYSHGVTPFADGKDQESTSEDINFHYALTLFGKATKNSQLETIGRLMLKLNARAIKTYFLMTNDNRAHPPTIVPNKVTGILFDNKADYATWFSPAKYAIHGIQMIPITPITEFVRTRQFVQEEWDQILSREPDVVNDKLDNPWLSLLYANYATVNKALAMQKLQRAAMDDGLTRTWALYMAATRP
ncbi:hypothetical protein PINS_up019951 [Pythium insidiosum]|nr:hypothetical protein PINS_up019951 [Pythium insidiosum]